MFLRTITDDGSSPAPAAPVTKAPTPAAPAASTRGNANKPRGGPASRGGKYYARGGAKTGDGAGNLNQNGVEEPSTEGRKCMSIQIRSN
jgi:plasminogen activator inhibitor 1 RNA-binding protein